jgi:cytochrome c peroxidase
LTQDPPVVHDDPSDYCKFKTAQLRMVEVTRPYMHNGAFATLEEVVDFYDQGGDADLSGTSTKSALIQPLNLTQAEKDDLVAFLRNGLLGTEIK